MSQNNWEADKMLDVYIHDYLVKRDLKASAQAFVSEAKVSSDPVAIDAPGGFLFEWWSVFWDIFIARTNEKHSDVAASYIETQIMKAREQQQQPQNPQQQQMLQQLLLHRQAQQQQQRQQLQQQREGGHLLNGSANGMIGNGPFMRENSGTANNLPTETYEKKLKLPVQGDSLDDAALKKFGDNVGQILDPTQASMSKAPVTASQSSGQVLHGAPGGMSPHMQARNQEFQGATLDIKPDINPILSPRAAAPEASLIGMPGPNQGANNLTLKGWPLTQPKPFMQNPQPFYHIQMLTPQQQQLLLAQQNSTSLSANDLESKRLRMLLNNRSLSLGRDGMPNAVGDVIPNMGPSLQGVGARPDPDMLMKLKMAQFQQQQLQGNNQSQQQQLQQQPLSSQQLPPGSNHHLQQDKAMAAGSNASDASMLNSFRGSEQVSKSQNARKRKQNISSSGPVDSSGTANTSGPSPSSAPSTPSTHTPGDVMSLNSLAHNSGSSKSMMMFAPENHGTMTSSANQQWNDKDLVQTGMDRFTDDVEDNVESFLSHNDTDHQDGAGRSSDAGKGITFSEVGSVRASMSKLMCCHFSSDGKLLATGGHDKKAVLWYMDGLKMKTTLEEHGSYITDVRFSPSMAHLATSSFDKTVKVWDPENPGYSLRSFFGHNGGIMSLDFHPNKDDLICSCDADGEIRYWSITDGLAGVFKGGSAQVRFQPRHGRYLAAAGENTVSIFDAESRTCLHSLKSHAKPFRCICWDQSGELLASLSEDSVKIWSMRSGNGDCLHELSCSNGNKFQSCIFHPSYSPVVIIGCYQSLELWSMNESQTMTLPAHEGLIASLAASTTMGMVASAGHDKVVKLWK